MLSIAQIICIHSVSVISLRRANPSRQPKSGGKEHGSPPGIKPGAPAPGSKPDIRKRCPRLAQSISTSTYAQASVGAPGETTLVLVRALGEGGALLGRALLANPRRARAWCGRRRRRGRSGWHRRGRRGVSGLGSSNRIGGLRSSRIGGFRSSSRVSGLRGSSRIGGLGGGGGIGGLARRRARAATAVRARGSTVPERGARQLEAVHIRIDIVVGEGAVRIV
jgi:hypothetical protein